MTITPKFLERQISYHERQAAHYLARAKEVRQGFRDTMLRDSNFGAQKKYYSSREELVEVNAKELAWGELNKLVRDRHVAPKELSSAQIVAALNALKGVA